MRRSPTPAQLASAVAVLTAAIPFAGASTPVGTPPSRGAVLMPPSATTSSTGVTNVAAARHTWDWPLAPRPQVLAPFDPPATRYGRGHRGLDLSATPGQQVRAVDDGVVTHVGVVAGRGTISVLHNSGIKSTYEPVRSPLSHGQSVRRGQVLGTVAGRSHCGERCIHLGALVGKGYLDPRPLLKGGPVILLPLP